MTRNRLIIIIVLLFITGVFVFLDEHFSKGAPPTKLDTLPLVIGDWTGKDFPVDERIREILETNYILSRDYANEAGKHVYLSVVYYPDNKIGFHNPEACNTGVGSYIVRRDVHSVSGRGGVGQSNVFKVNRLVMGGARGDKVILYFFVSGNYVTNDYLKFRLHMMKEQMLFRIPSGAQIQVHSAIEPDQETTMSDMKDFIVHLKPLLPQYLY